MSSDRLECDACGTLNVLTAKFCSLCDKSLAAEDDRRRSGDPRIMVVVASVTTVLFACALPASIILITASGVRSIHLTLVAWLATFFLGMLTVGFWRGAKRALDARKR